MPMILDGRSLSWLATPFAPIAQMAMTNYLMQSVAIVLSLARTDLSIYTRHAASQARTRMKSEKENNR